jgi:hypothetical protein
MAFWSRKPGRQRPRDWIATQTRQLQLKAAQLAAQASRSHGVSYTDAQAAFEAYVPTYKAQERLAGMAEALNGLALQSRLDGSIDGYQFEDVTRQCEHIAAAFKDVQQSLGLLLFFPEDNGRLLPSHPTDEDWSRARTIGESARAKFQDFWNTERGNHSDGRSDAAEGYASMMASYTQATGRQAVRVPRHTIPPEMRPES